MWDFCRAVDDAVDEAPGEGAAKERAGRERIGWWRQELARCFDGGTPESEQGRALVPFDRAIQPATPRPSRR